MPTTQHRTSSSSSAPHCPCSCSVCTRCYCTPPRDRDTPPPHTVKRTGKLEIAAKSPHFHAPTASAPCRATVPPSIGGQIIAPAPTAQLLRRHFCTQRYDGGSAKVSHFEKRNGSDDCVCLARQYGRLALLAAATHAERKSVRVRVCWCRRRRSRCRRGRACIAAFGVRAIAAETPRPIGTHTLTGQPFSNGRFTRAS